MEHLSLKTLTACPPTPIVYSLHFTYEKTKAQRESGLTEEAQHVPFPIWYQNLCFLHVLKNDQWFGIW